MAARLKAWTILIVMGLVWGLSFSLAKIAAVAGIHPFSIAFWEALTAAVILIAINLARRQVIPIGRELILFYFVAGLLGMVIPNILLFYAASHAPAGILSITIAVVPLITFAASAFLGLEAFDFLRIGGVCLGTIAIVLLVGPEQSLPDPALVPWILVSLTGAACYAALNVVMAVWTPRRATSFTTTTGTLTSATITMVPILLMTGTFVPLGWPWTGIEWSLLGLGLINAIAFPLFLYLISTAGPVFSSQTANVVTLFGVLWGIAIFNERHTLWVWLSLAAMMAALALVAPRQNKRALVP